MLMYKAQALFRRFDDVLHYMLPAHMEIKRLLEYKIKSYDENFTIPKDVILQLVFESMNLYSILVISFV